MGKFRVLRDDYPDTDMESQDFYKFAMHEGKQSNKIAFYDEVSFTMTAGSDHASAVIPHNLGYTPVVHPTIKYGTKGFPFMGVFMPQIEVPSDDSGFGYELIIFFVLWDATNVTIDAYTSLFGTVKNNETFTLEAYIMLDEQ